MQCASSHLEVFHEALMFIKPTLHMFLFILEALCLTGLNALQSLIATLGGSRVQTFHARARQTLR
eukprot:5821955-Amphidinium_carterae.1